MIKRNGKNIITSDDVTVLGKNSGKSLLEVLEKLLNEADSLKSNVKWLYKYGGVGGSGGGGGGSTITDKWTVVCSLGNILIPETTEGTTVTKSILFSNSGTYRLYIHINNPGGDTYTVEYSYNGGKSTGRATLNSDNRWTYSIGINLIENNSIHISVMNGNMLEKTFDAVHIVNAYSVWSYLADDTGLLYETFTESGVEKYNLFIDDIKQRGLKFITKYNASVNIPVTYYYTKFRSLEEVRETTLFREGDHEETLVYVDAIDNLENMTDDDAAPYTFLMKLNIDNTEVPLNVSADFLPNDLYLKIIPSDSDLILYTDTTNPNPLVLITGNKTFTITPYNGKTGGSGKINITYFINGVLVVDSSTSLPALDSISPGKAFLKTFMFSLEGWNEIIFRAGSGDRYKDFTYYIYTEIPSNVVDWFNVAKRPFSSAFYRYGDSLLNQVKLIKNGNTINPNTYVIKNANDIVDNEVILSSEATLALELMINIGIQYNYINDESKEIIEIPTTDQSDTNSIHIYLNKILIGASEPQGIFFLEEEEKYNVDNKDNYHLLTIARKYIRTSGISTHQYELSFYIDGVLQANTLQHVLPSIYDRFIIKNGNYSINLLDISYFNNGNITETDVVLYWYAYLTRLQLNFENISLKINLLNAFSKFNLEHIDDDPMKLLTGHVSISESTLMDLVLNVTVPILCMEYEPSANMDALGNPMLFLTPPIENASEGWSDTLYDPDSHNSLKLTIGLKWSNGTGTVNTTLLTIDTSSILTPDGLQRSAKFTLDILGSTTRSYKGKNYILGIEFTDSSDLSYIPIFTPWFDSNNKNSFLPENSFTLKADIVDSSHTNNTCMGKFINENTDLFDDAKLMSSVYSGHIKNCLEGFPCLLFVHSSGSLKYYYLGIYNFNLGRTSNFNLGYCDLRALPLLNSSSNKDFHIYSVAKATTSSSYGSDIKQGLITAEIDGNEAWYDFSLYDESILFLLPNRPNDEGYMFSEIISGRDTSGNLSQYTKSAISNFVKKASRSGGYVFDKIERGFHNNIEYNYTTLPGYVPNARTQYRRIKNNEIETFEIIPEKSFLPGSAQDFNSEDLINFIYSHTENDLENVAPYSNYRSIVEYYTICMAFGLLDSVLKNLNIKSWNEGNTFYLAFYDMDTCLGINNDGKNVSYYAFSDYWLNTSGEIIDYDENQVPIILTPPITIYRDHAPKISNVNLYDVPSSYVFAIAKYARSIIQYYNLSSNESNISIDTLITPQTLWAQWRSINGSLKNSKYFIDLYYNGYMTGINELMFNYDFKAKYFKELTESTYDLESSRFRGRSIGYLKDWLNKRFHILDAYFNLAGNREIYISDGANYNQTLDTTSGYLIVYEQYPVGLITYSDDVNINKSIFGENSSISGDIDIVVQAPDYTPIITTVGRSMYRYLLEESSNKYNIKIRNNGTNKVIFGGSSMWTYIENIDSLAEGNVFILSDKLQVLNGLNGTVNAWDLRMPALQEIHLNSPNYAGDLNFDRDSDLYNLTTIDIRNSKINLNIDNQNVRTINLTNVKSGSIQILNCNFIQDIVFNSSIITNCIINPVNYIPTNGTMTLDNNSITNLELSTGNNLNLNISNDPILTNLIISGFKTVTITNCPNLQTITSSGENLISINVTECTNVLTVSLNVKNCTSIKIPNTPVLSLTLNTSSDFSKIKTLDLSSSLLTKITYNLISNGSYIELYIVPQEYTDTINLSPLTGLTNLNIGSNINIKNIIFANDFDHPIPIVNSFTGCSNLERVFGCIEISNTYLTFFNLSKFTVHGELTDLWKNLNKVAVKDIGGTNYNIVLTPLLLLSGEESIDTHDQIITKYNLVSKSDLFLEGTYVTNIFFKPALSNTSFTDFMNGTNITLFDVYYILNSFGLSNVTKNVTLGNGAFHSRRSMFDYSTGNLLNRYTFYKCSRITSLSATTTIFNAGSNSTLLYSPTKTGDTFIDNGLLSPLTGLTRITELINGTVYTSRFLLRRSSGNYGITALTYLTFSVIYDDIDNYELSSQIPTFFDSSTRVFISQDYQNKLGNLTDMFKQTPNLLSITDSFKMSVVNYSTLKFPNTITTLKNIFNNTYGFGEFNWKQTFDSTLTYSGLVTIANSFILENFLRNYGMENGDNNYVRFEISESMFNNMPNLLNLGYISTTDASGGSVTNPSSSVSYSNSFGLHGDGFDKVLENGIFPYNITSSISKIINFVGLFSELYLHSTSPIQNSIDFPGTLFVNGNIVKTPNLRNIAALFRNSNVLLNLTSEGFKGCTNLLIISSLFSNRLVDNTMLSGVRIPYRLFYLGEETKTKTYYGTNDISVMNNDIAYMEDSETGSEFDLTDSNNIFTVTYKNPLKKILYAALCFYGQKDILPYIWDKTDFDITLYPNENYIPFAYYKDENTGLWKIRPDDPKYTKQYDISSIYDGDPDHLESNAYCKDSEIVESILNDQTTKTTGIDSYKYFCPPDLFEPFSNLATTNINGMFLWCGYGPNSSSQSLRRRWNDTDYIQRIMHGRICPYLFDTISNIQYLTEFFEHCKGITSYKISSNGRTYLIPPDLFKVANKVIGLRKTFAGMYFDTAPNYEFLTNLKNTLDIRGIFSMCMYKDSYNISSSTFYLNILNSVDGAFCNRAITLDSSKSVTAPTATNNIPSEPNTCIFNNVISGSKNANKTIYSLRQTIKFLYYRNTLSSNRFTEDYINLTINNNVETT